MAVCHHWRVFCKPLFYRSAWLSFSKLLHTETKHYPEIFSTLYMSQCGHTRYVRSLLIYLAPEDPPEPRTSACIRRLLMSGELQRATTISFKVSDGARNYALAAQNAGLPTSNISDMVLLLMEDIRHMTVCWRTPDVPANAGANRFSISSGHVPHTKNGPTLPTAAHFSSRQPALFVPLYQAASPALSLSGDLVMLIRRLARQLESLRLENCEFAHLKRLLAAEPLVFLQLRKFELSACLVPIDGRLILPNNPMPALTHLHCDSVWPFRDGTLLLQNSGRLQSLRLPADSRMFARLFSQGAFTAVYPCLHTLQWLAGHPKHQGSGRLNGAQFTAALHMSLVLRHMHFGLPLTELLPAHSLPSSLHTFCSPWLALHGTDILALARACPDLRHICLSLDTIGPARGLFAVRHAKPQTVPRLESLLLANVTSTVRADECMELLLRLASELPALADIAVRTNSHTFARVLAKQLGPPLLHFGRLRISVALLPTADRL
ncbi:hypothetical protein DL89DRAFT_266820 [Linderina pennispora]|uniref:F-box domain-containing protein n=1 Tax=Linderina pennispora TaxID=61395 RepID=A0A1Y1WBL0_9FUNG|nr:uncharacterized protein DL89DRAFT_266820 [Linderina pennispora]ORX70636.1 hypothetical protein DL89DRAFT_266820 [Linderina pennispora]